MKNAVSGLCRLAAVRVWGSVRSLPVFPASPRGAVDRGRAWRASRRERGRAMARGIPRGLGITALMARDLGEIVASRLAKGLGEERHGNDRQTARGQLRQSKDMDVVIAVSPPPASCLLQKAWVLTGRRPEGPRCQLLLASPVRQSSRLRHRSLYPPFRCRKNLIREKWWHVSFSFFFFS